MKKLVKVGFSPLWKRALARFVRTFIFGGLATMSIQFIDAPTISTLSGLKVWLFALIVGFLSGGIAAIDKAYRG